MSGEAAERILSGEPDGSFVVRDSSDQHYIFSLTFKLNGFVRHVRIEHDQGGSQLPLSSELGISIVMITGNFSFGSFTRFKSHTIVDFIENAVEHSRSGRYLFFLHRRPVRKDKKEKYFLFKQFSFLGPGSHASPTTPSCVKIQACGKSAAFMQVSPPSLS